MSKNTQESNKFLYIENNSTFETFSFLLATLSFPKINKTNITLKQNMIANKMLVDILKSALD